MILSAPPHFGQCPGSKAQASAQTNLYTSYVGANTRLSSLAQLSRTGWWRAQGVARRVAANSRSWWRNSAMLLNSVLTIDHFDRLGLPRLS